ncbi:MAG: TrkH family potassium uptake protein [Gaiellaceae bacterium]
MITAARLRRAFRRETIGVDVGAALNLVGALLRYFSATFLAPAAVALGYGEPPWPFLAAGAITAGLGIGLERLTPGKERVGAREGYFVIALVWLLVAAAGALPYMLAGEEQLRSPVDAYFESMSGFTTTGASVLTDIEGLSRSLAFWRQLTTWVGGMGILVLALAVLPRLRVGGRQLFESEAPGPEVERLTVTIREAARRFLLLYVAITALGAAVLTVIGLAGFDDAMNLYEAVGHSFAAVATAGFSTQARSFEEFSAATQWTVVVFMIVAGTNFALTYAAIVRRRPRVFLRDEEFRLYVPLLALGSALVLAELLRADLLAGEAAVRHAVFNAVSTMTTTGFVSADFNEWTALTSVTLVGLMFVGASAGSTSGSVKVVRHVLVGKILRRELDQTVHPELVAPIHLNRSLIDERTLGAVIVFVLLYIGFFALGALGILIDSARLDVVIRPIDAIAASATTLGNVGPALGIAGPMGSFDPFGTTSKLIMIALMWLGRLEILPVVVLLTRSYWRA